MAIEAKQYDKKEELIAKFYTLRAGLSVIADQSEIIMDSQRECNVLLKQKKDFLSNKERENSLQRTTYLQEKDRLDRKLQSTQKEIEKASKQITRLENELKPVEKTKKHLFFAFLFGILLFLSFCFFIGFQVSELVYSSEFAASYVEVYYVIFFIPFLIFTIYHGKTYSKKKKKKKEITAQIHLSNATLDKGNETILHILEAKASLIKPDCMRIPFNKEEAYDTYSKELYAQQRNQLADTFQITQDVRSFLVDQFSNLLVEADWENVDLLIFYLETGRADTLKEALQLVDQQRQADQISSAIRDASNHISRSLYQNTARLAATMSICFEKLSNQIDRNHIESIQRLDQMGEAMDHASVNILSYKEQVEGFVKNQEKAIVSAQELNDSLIQNMNKNSQELMDSLRFNLSVATGKSYYDFR